MILQLQQFKVGYLVIPDLYTANIAVLTDSCIEDILAAI